MSIKQQAQVIISVSIMCVCILIFGAGIRRGEWIEYPITNIEPYVSNSPLKEPDTGYVKWAVIEYDNRQQKICYNTRHRSDKGFDYIRIYESGFYEVYLVDTELY